MVREDVLECFLKEAPACVMVRATLERMFAAKSLDELFQTHAEGQYVRELLFSTVVDLMLLAVCRVTPSVHAAYQRRSESISVSVKSLYNKINSMETHVSEALVRHSADVASALVDRLGEREALLPGYRLKVVDGNHMTGTDHRLGVLRHEGGAALPGVAVAVLDPQRRLFEQVIVEEDAYTQETQMLQPVLERLTSKDVILADRLYCTSQVLFGIMARDASFIVRQHQGHLRWKLQGRREFRGRCETGKVFEQKVLLTNPQTGQTSTVRRITIELDHPVRNGETELHLLTNLPVEVASAVEIAGLYHHRWTVETAFQEMTDHLQCELGSLGHPQAALFTFCVAAASYNAFGVVHAALRNAHGEEHVEENVSAFYLTEEVRGTYRGMMIALPSEEWEEYQTLSIPRLSQQLLRWAETMNLSRYQKHRRGKKHRKSRTFSPTKHVSTARLINNQRSTTSNKN